MTSAEARSLIIRFIDGDVGPWEWDDFITLRHKDPIVDQLQRDVITLERAYPPTERGGWTSAEGLEKLRDLAKSEPNV